MEQHSEKFETVKNWWTVMRNEKMIANAVKKGWITEAEYEEIIGEVM